MSNKYVMDFYEIDVDFRKIDNFSLQISDIQILI